MTLKKISPWREDWYLKWVSTLPCAIEAVYFRDKRVNPASNKSEPVRVCDAHHVKIKGVTGGSVKPHDFMAIPLCRRLHSEGGQIGWLSWEGKYAITQFELVRDTLRQAVKVGVIKVKGGGLSASRVWNEKRYIQFVRDGFESGYFSIDVDRCKEIYTNHFTVCNLPIDRVA